MRIIIRELMRFILLLLSEEWENALQDKEAAQAVHTIRSLCNAELQIFRIALTDLESLQADATRAIAHCPAAQGLITEMLQERMQQVAGTVREKATRQRRAA